LFWVLWLLGLQSAASQNSTCIHIADDPQAAQLLKLMFADPLFHPKLDIIKFKNLLFQGL